jgi:hypothetical protein
MWRFLTCHCGQTWLASMPHEKECDNLTMEFLLLFPLLRLLKSTPETWVASSLPPKAPSSTVHEFSALCENRRTKRTWLLASPWDCHQMWEVLNRTLRTPMAGFSISQSCQIGFECGFLPPPFETSAGAPGWLFLCSSNGHMIPKCPPPVFCFFHSSVERHGHGLSLLFEVHHG